MHYFLHCALAAAFKIERCKMKFCSLYLLKDFFKRKRNVYKKGLCHGLLNNTHFTICQTLAFGQVLNLLKSDNIKHIFYLKYIIPIY